MKILVTGATGYVGGRLVPLLLERGHTVRTTTSNPDREQPWWGDQVETVVMDVLDPESGRVRLRRDGRGLLPDPWDGWRRLRRDRSQGGRQSCRRGARHDVERVVYLSGIVPDVADEEELSEHIRSRREVEQILKASPATVVVCAPRCSSEAGRHPSRSSGRSVNAACAHASPLGWTPWCSPSLSSTRSRRWSAPSTTPGPSRHFDLGGPDQLRYGALLDAYTSHAGLERPQVEVPFVPTGARGDLGRQPHGRAAPHGRGIGGEPAPRHGRSGRRLPRGAFPGGTPSDRSRRGIPPLACRACDDTRGHGPDGTLAAGPGLGEWRRRSARMAKVDRCGEGRPARTMSAAGWCAGSRPRDRRAAARTDWRGSCLRFNR